MFDLKTLSLEAVPRALAKAERYRLLNEPGEAESICLDALTPTPTIRRRCHAAPGPHRSVRRESAARLGCVEYRGADARRLRARVLLGHHARAACQGPPGSSNAAGRLAGVRWLREAMSSYERAEAIRPSE